MVLFKKYNNERVFNLFYSKFTNLDIICGSNLFIQIMSIGLVFLVKVKS